MNSVLRESRGADGIGLVLFVSGICGLYFGLTSGWQIAVESAQAVAGVVSYPADNPFYMYHVKSWTLLHQIPAALLALGCSEQVVSVLVACVPAVLGFQALALLTYSFGRDRTIASLIPVVLLAANVCQDCGAVYPIRLISNVYWATYGVTGTAYVLFTWSLLGVGLRRPVALLCGLAPAVHPALGTWCIAAVAVALACDWRAERERAATLARWFAAGAMLTASSFLVQQYLSRHVPAADPELTQQLLEAFVADWDNHRFAFPLDHIEWRLGWCALAVFSVALAWSANDLPHRSLVLLRVLLISALAGLAMCVLTHASAWLPTPLVMAMPGRFINLAVVAFPAMLIGLLSRRCRQWTSEGFLAALLLSCLLRSLTLLKQWIYVPAAPKVFLASGLILICLIAAKGCAIRGWLKTLVRGGATLGLLATAFLERRDWHLAGLLLAVVAFMWVGRHWLDRPAWPSVHRTCRAIAVACPTLVLVMMVGPWLACGLAAAAACITWQPWLRHRPEDGLLGRLGCHLLRLEDGLLSLIASVGNALRDVPSSGGAASTHSSRNATEGVPYSYAPTSCLNWMCWFAACLLATSLIAVPLAARARQGLASLRGWNNDPVFAAAAKSQGLLLTVPRLGIAQLRSRRGLVLYGQALNQITYVPSSGPAINRVLKGIYDEDLLKPRPPGWVKCGGIMHDSARGVWQARDPDEWQRLGREFGFSAILTYRDWRLRLPIAAQNAELTLYRMAAQPDRAQKR
ncbi:MAG TPA: hypothetical protein VJ783_26980 [Pirellulales bacterium]|nr:hypothetical protein [Pirellulales bacterium]